MKYKAIITKALTLGIGLAIGILLISKVCYEKSYDTCYRDAEQIYQIRTLYTQSGENMEYDNISGGVAPGFKQYVPGIDAATRTTFIYNSARFIDENNNAIEAGLVAADTSFFEVFDTEILVGDPKKVLAQAATAMVSESFAQKLGGAEQAVGKIIYNEESPDFKITIGGVYKDFPQHSSIRKEVLLSMESLYKESTENWVGNDRYKGYVRLAKGTNPDMLAPAIREMQEKSYPPEVIKMAESSGTDIHYFLTPLVGKHTASEQMRDMIVILSVVAVLLIAISLLNYILMSVSAMVKRSKEMGVRKCYGADAGSIYGVMAKEAIVDIMAALFVSALIILALRSSIEDMIGVPLDALFVNATYISVACVIALVFIIAALVPGYLYSNIPVGVVLKSYSDNKRFWKLGLLFVQAMICSLLLALTFIINAQYHKAINDRPGYAYENLLWTVLTGTDNSVHQSIIDELKILPEVVDVQMSYSLPLDYSSGNNVFLPNENYTELFNIADQYWGSSGLFDLLEIPFVAGRYPQNAQEVAVSESFVKKMMEFQDWSDGAVGKMICITEHCQTPNEVLTISGVYRDYRINTLTNQDTRASVKFYGEVGKDYMPFMAIKVREVNTQTIDKVERIIQKRIEHKEVEVRAYKDSMREVYSGERRMRNTVMAGCLVSILIAIFGLVGYVRDESQRRSKEMAVRKINGATTTDVIKVYIYEILKLSLVAIIIGNIGGYYVASVWLENFSEKISLSAWYFVATDLLIILMIVATVVINSLRIASANPVELLKNE